MKYETTNEFVKAIKDGKFTGRVIIDTYQVHAFEGDTKVCDFEDAGPEGALIDVLTALGVSAERPTA